MQNFGAAKALHHRARKGRSMEQTLLIFSKLLGSAAALIKAIVEFLKLSSESQDQKVPGDCEAERKARHD